MIDWNCRYCGENCHSTAGVCVNMDCMSNRRYTSKGTADCPDEVIAVHTPRPRFDLESILSEVRARLKDKPLRSRSEIVAYLEGVIDAMATMGRES